MIASTTYPVKLALSSADSRCAPHGGRGHLQPGPPSARTYRWPPEAVFGAPDGVAGWVYGPGRPDVHARELAIGELTSGGWESSPGQARRVGSPGHPPPGEGQKARLRGPAR